jgi:serine/threonine-protein kinase
MRGDDPRIGTELGGYRIESLIGRGGMGVVYLAIQPRLERRVAVKVLAPRYADDAEFRERFERESQLAAAIDHQNILPVHEAGEADGLLFIAMRYVDGTDLRTVLERERQLDPDRTLAILGQVAEALDAAHAAGLVHRDVKPGNILLAAGGHVYLADFGVAKQSSADSTLTRRGVFVGTVDYAAPEQIQGLAVDGRADVYALGCILYECLAGARPYERSSEVAVLLAHLGESPPRLTDTRRDLPAGLDVVVATALAKAPDDRYSTCTRLVAAARSALAAPRDAPSTVLLPPAAAETVPVRAPPPPTRRGRRPWVPIAAAVALLAVAGAVVGVVLATRGDGEEPVGAEPTAEPTLADGEAPPSEPEAPPATPTATGEAAYPGLADVRAASPSWSGEDGRLAYAVEEGGVVRIVVRTAGGREARPTSNQRDNGDPSLSYNGRLAFVSERENTEIYATNTQLRDPVQVTSSPAQDLTPAWAPGDIAIAFSSDRGGSLDLYRIAVDEGELEGATPRALTSDAATDDVDPAWSPDGDTIAFTRHAAGDPCAPAGVWVVDKAGTTASPLVDDSADERQPTWSPDGAFVAFSSDADGDYEIMVLAATGGVATQLTDNDVDDFAPAWHPDGTGIAFLQGEYDCASAEPAGQLRLLEVESTP